MEQSGGTGDVLSREDAAGGEVAPSTEFRRGSQEPPRTISKKASCGPEEIPNSEQELAEWVRTKHLELRDALEIGPNELVVETSQLIAKGALAVQAFSVRPSTVRNMVTKVRFLHQWCPVLSRCGMRAVRPEAGFWQRKWTVQGNPGPARLIRPVEGGDVRPKQDSDEETPVPGRGFRFDDSTSPQEPEPVPFRPSRRAALVTQFSGCTPQSCKMSGQVVQLQPQPVPAFLGFRGGSRWALPTLAKLSLANTNFGQTKSGQTKFGQHHILVFEVGVGGRFGWEVVRVGAPKEKGFEGRGPLT